jgi:hypothetical protein
MCKKMKTSRHYITMQPTQPTQTSQKTIDEAVTKFVNSGNPQCIMYFRLPHNCTGLITIRKELFEPPVCDSMIIRSEYHDVYSVRATLITPTICRRRELNYLSQETINPKFVLPALNSAIVRLLNEANRYGEAIADRD